MMTTKQIVKDQMTCTMVLSFCSECGDHCWKTEPHHASFIAGVDTLMIYRWLDQKQVHFTESSGAESFICMNSLPN